MAERRRRVGWGGLDWFKEVVDGPGGVLVMLGWVMWLGGEGTAGSGRSRLCGRGK